MEITSLATVWEGNNITGEGSSGRGFKGSITDDRNCGMGLGVVLLAKETWDTFGGSITDERNCGVSLGVASQAKETVGWDLGVASLAKETKRRVRVWG